MELCVLDNFFKFDFMQTKNNKFIDNFDLNQVKSITKLQSTHNIKKQI